MRVPVEKLERGVCVDVPAKRGRSQDTARQARYTRVDHLGGCERIIVRTQPRPYNAQALAENPM